MYSDDNLDANWGHHQFTAGSMTITTTLNDWSNIGGVEFAQKIIAATIRTCKIARQLCFAKKILTKSYLTDCYLENIVGTIWNAWKTTGRVKLPPKILISCLTTAPSPYLTAMGHLPTQPPR